MTEATKPQRSHSSSSSSSDSSSTQECELCNKEDDCDTCGSISHCSSCSECEEYEKLQEKLAGKKRGRPPAKQKNKEKKVYYMTDYELIEAEPGKTITVKKKRTQVSRHKLMQGLGPLEKPGIRGRKPVTLDDENWWYTVTKQDVPDASVQLKYPF